MLSRDVSIDTDPAGARVSYRPYGGADGDWTEIGVSPVAHASVPNSYLEWKAEMPGRRPAYDAPVFLVSPDTSVRFRMRVPEDGQVPDGMVYAVTDSGPYSIPIPGLEHLPPVTLQDFWIDRFEVTNRQFKRFVDAGGYADQKYWREPFVAGSGKLNFTDAVRQFTDTTGRPGPATWEFGAYPEGEDDYPVRGVSWFEAAAYAAFAGRDLPTLYHWSLAAAQRSSTYVVPKSNFAGHGPVKVGVSGAVHRFGTFDLAGNVKEWCRNRADESRRYILGGAWDEPVYMFNDPDARSPFERRENFGFRTVKYPSGEALATLGQEVVAFEARNYAIETPASDSVFAAYRGAYTYDASPLDARVDGTDASNPDWVVERVSYAAAYGGERVPALLYLPKRAKPPYQAVVLFPGSNVLQTRSSALINPRGFDWIVKSGRAVIHPIYKSTFERGDEVTTDYPNRSAAFRDHVLMWSKDVGRTVDYLESRTDIRADALAFMGVSWGGAMGPVFVAVEPRFKTAMFIAAGFYQQHSLPEVDALHFAPRVRVPSLMLDGKYDFYYPTATAQEPMFRLLGTPSRDKRRQVYDAGHNLPRPDMIKETADWLDRYLGPVN
jgi:dienelactone hydrolase